MTVAKLQNQQPENVDRADYTPDKGSLAWRLDQLDVGATLSESKRIPADELSLSDTKTTLDGMSSTISSSVNRLQSRTDKRFMSERGKWLTSSDDVMCTIAVTRTA